MERNDPIMQVSRRHHRKSRAGCTTCKSKKIKCDESKPRCQYCVLRSLECNYPELIPTRHGTNTLNKPSTHLSKPSELTAESTSAVSTPSSLAIPTSLPANPSFGSKQWSLLDLELLHFYTAETSLTFCTSPIRQNVWRNVLPAIAFSNHFLLHGILAIAAVHLSLVSPERKSILRQAATSHHALALPIFREAIESLDEGKWEACTAFGVLITVYEWATCGKTSNLFFNTVQHPDDVSISGWIQLFRGSGELIHKHYEALSRSQLAPIFTLDLRFETEKSLLETRRFVALKKLWEVPTDSGEALSSADVESLDEALQWLQIIYTAICDPQVSNNLASVAMTWLAKVSLHYLHLVNLRHPVALVVLSHYSLLLNRVQDFWWIRGTSRLLLQQIRDALGEGYDEWLAWPLQDLVLTEFKNQSIVNNS